MTALPAPIQQLMLEMQVESIQRQRKAVLADPVRHKKTLHFPEGAPMNYRYYRVDKASWPKVDYCWSTGRNLAGYFLGWRETTSRDGSGKRDMWLASKRRDVVKVAARDRRDAHNARVQPKPKVPLEQRRTTYWISERVPGTQPGVTGSRGLGKVVVEGGPNAALDAARTKWPDAGEIVAVHIGRR